MQFQSGALTKSNRHRPGHKQRLAPRRFALSARRQLLRHRDPIGQREPADFTQVGKRTHSFRWLVFGVVLALSLGLAGKAHADLVWAGLEGGGGARIRYSADSGTTWETQPLDSGRVRPSDVMFIDATHGWAVHFNRVAYTSDAGATWTNGPAASDDLNELDFVTTSTGWVVGDSGIIQKTTDGGVTWSTQTSGSTQHLNGVSFVNADLGWAVGNGGTLMSTADGGSTWTTQTSPNSTTAYQKVEFIDELTGWAVGNRGRIVHTADGGASWTAQNSGLSSSFTITGLSFVDNQKGWVTSSTRILSTSDGGVTWAQQTTPSGISTLNDIFFLDENNGWAVGAQGVLLHTSDGGLNWLLQDNGFSGPTGDDFTDVWVVAAVPEPSASMFGGLVCSVIAAVYFANRRSPTSYPTDCVA
ncbi:MAG: YCF48-related protein [Pirellulaceae bacterium]